MSSEINQMCLDVRVNSIVPNNPNSKLRASASVTMNGCFVVKSVKIYEGQKGLFVTMPCYKTGNGGYKDYCHPVTKEFRKQLNGAVLAAYDEAIAQGHQAANSVNIAD